MDIEKNAVDRQLAVMITQLAQAVGRNVVAEGIETASQAAYLRSIGCEAAQDYYYCLPMILLPSVTTGPTAYATHYTELV